ncbi:hypothetical protein V6N13_110938 [Hibiscus sabdariffa]
MAAPIRGSTGVLDREIWEFQAYRRSVSAAHGRRSDLRLLLGVMGAHLALVHVSFTDPLSLLSIKDTPIVNPLSLLTSLVIELLHFLRKMKIKTIFAFPFSDRK